MNRLIEKIDSSPIPPHLNFGKVEIQEVTPPANPPYISIWISTKNVLAVIPLLRDRKIKVNGPASHGQYKIVRSSPIYRRELCRGLRRSLGQGGILCLNFKESRLILNTFNACGKHKSGVFNCSFLIYDISFFFSWAPILIAIAIIFVLTGCGLCCCCCRGPCCVKDEDRKRLMKKFAI